METLEQFEDEVRTWLSANATLRAPDPTDWVDYFRYRSPEQVADEIARGRVLQRSLADARLAALTWPAEYGGRGASTDRELLFRQLAAPYDLSLLHTFRIGFGQCGPTILHHGTEEQKLRHLPDICTGDDIWCQLFSEPDAGSDLSNIQTNARQDDDTWVVNGQKTWTSGANHSDYGLLLARTRPGTSGRVGLSMFIVPMDTAGVEARPIVQMTGATNFCEVYFTDVTLSDDAMVGNEGDGWAAAMTMLTAERRAIGARPGFHDQLRSFERFLRANRPDGHRLDASVDAYVTGRVAQLLSNRTQSLASTDQSIVNDGQLVKLAINRAARQMSVIVSRSAGADIAAWNPDSSSDIWRLMVLNTPGSSIAAGTDEIQKNILAERALGLPK